MLFDYSLLTHSHVNTMPLSPPPWMSYLLQIGYISNGQSSAVSSISTMSTSWLKLKLRKRTSSDNGRIFQRCICECTGLVGKDSFWFGGSRHTVSPEGFRNCNPVLMINVLHEKKVTNVLCNRRDRKRKVNEKKSRRENEESQKQRPYIWRWWPPPRKLPK